MERSFRKEVELLTLGAGQTFRGEGILAVTKALLQSGVSYVGGYQGAPVSHMMDVLNDARDIIERLGVHIETNASEAGAAAMLGASINYPLRGAVTWKSTVGTNVASDALSNLASAGVRGGALIVIGEDYGEGASIIQERSHAFAMKSQIWLLDPRPNLPTIVQHGGKRLRALGGLQHAGDARAAHPRLPRARRLRSQGQSRAADFAQADPRATRFRLRAHLAAAGDLRAGKAQGRSALARGREIHPREPAERGVRGSRSERDSASSARAACTTRRCAPSISSGLPTPSANRKSRSTRSTSPIR